VLLCGKQLRVIDLTVLFNGILTNHHLVSLHTGLLSEDHLAGNDLLHWMIWLYFRYILTGWNRLLNVGLLAYRQLSLEHVLFFFLIYIN